MATQYDNDLEFVYLVEKLSTLSDQILCANNAEDKEALLKQYEKLIPQKLESQFEVSSIF